jgi:hypothetical protein
MIETAVNRVNSTPGCSLIDNVVVDERSRVDHFSDLRQAAVAGPQLTVGGYCPRKQEHNAGSQPLTTCSKQMLCCSLQNWMASSYKAAQVGQQGI